MIIKVSQGKGFRGVLSYLLRREKAEIIAGNMRRCKCSRLIVRVRRFETNAQGYQKPVFMRLCLYRQVNGLTMRLGLVLPVHT